VRTLANLPGRGVPLPSRAAAALVAAVMLCLPGRLPSAATEETDPQTQTAPVPDELQDKPFREMIALLEAEQGAYASGLSEQLLSLGLALQRQGRHEEALGLFKRGAHLARVNNGLYSAEQLPMIRAEIASYLATGDYHRADERQQYLYRVQLQSLGSGPVMTDALMQQARWQFSAYRLGIGGPGFLRLMNMWELYLMALNDILTREGENSAALLPPLYGLLRAQYLIADYQGGDLSADDGYRSSVEYNRFLTYRSESFDKGRAVIRAIYDVEQAGNEGDHVAAAESLVLMGDWLLWNEDRDAAWRAYGEALAELEGLDDAQVEEERLLGRPTPLPILDGVRSLPDTVDPQEGDILVQFSVTPGGKVVDLERVDDHEVEEHLANRLLRKLRKTRFRPRYEQGERVRTDKITWAYDIE